MELQNLAVGIIICAALAYIGVRFFKKLKGFKKNSACGNDCGCGSKSEKPFVKIRQNQN